MGLAMGIMVTFTTQNYSGLPRGQSSPSLQSPPTLSDATLTLTFTSAMGPPTCASGVTWPMTKPCEPPEKRPSVMSAHSLPSPAPMMADVGVSISGMPGPPLGPSYLQGGGRGGRRHCNVG